MTSIDEILQRVARGELAPADALAAIDAGGAAAPAPWPPDEGDDGPWRADLVDDDPDELEDDDPDVPPGGEDPSADVPPADDLPPPPPGRRPRPRAGRAGSDPGLRAVCLRTLAHAVDVFADPSVAEAVITAGPATMRRQGDRLIVEQPGAPTVDPGARFAFVAQIPHKVVAAGLAGLDDRIVLRIHPDLLLDVEAAAASLRVWGCGGGLRLRLKSSSVKLDRVAGPLDVSLFSSSIKGTAAVTGQGTITCQQSSVKLGLLPGSDVRIEARNRMGKVVLPARRLQTGTTGGGRGTAVVGRGRGRLEIDATMSSVILGSDR